VPLPDSPVAVDAPCRLSLGSERVSAASACALSQREAKARSCLIDGEACDEAGLAVFERLAHAVTPVVLMPRNIPRQARQGVIAEQLGHADTRSA
jgi:hypothetical protein